MSKIKETLSANKKLGLGVGVIALGLFAASKMLQGEDAEVLDINNGEPIAG